MEYDELDLDTLGEEKTALFVIITDTDESYMWGRIMNIDVSTYKDENSKTLMYMSEEKVRDIIEKCTDSRFLDVFEEKTVNVLKVNLMLDGIL